MKALFIGLGGAGQRHLRNLRQLRPDARIAAMRHKNRTFAINTALQADHSVDIMEHYGITTCSDWEAVSQFAPDFAVVANPSALHFDTCTHLLERGIPLFLEKPMTVDGDDLDSLVTLSTRAALPVMVAYQLRQHPCVKKAKEWLDEGCLGRIFSAEARVHSYMPGWHPYEDYTDLYAARKSMGGGVVLTEIHEIDLMAWFFGRPRRLWASGGTVGRFAIDVEDTVCATMEMAGDGYSWPATLHLSFVQNPPSRHFAVFGEKGTLHLDIVGDAVVFNDVQAGTVERFSLTGFDRNRMFLDELSHFLDCLESGAEPEGSLVGCLPGQQTANAIKRSLQHGGVESVS